MHKNISGDLIINTNDKFDIIRAHFVRINKRNKNFDKEQLNDIVNKNVSTLRDKMTTN